MSPSTTLYNLIKELFLLLDHDDRQLLAQFDLSLSRFYALNHLGREPGLSVSQLSALMLCDKSNISRLVRGMEVDGLVLRQPDESDRRKLHLYLTSAGMALRDEVLHLHDQNNQRRFNGSLAQDEQENLLNSLDRLKVNLRTTIEVMNY